MKKQLLLLFAASASFSALAQTSNFDMRSISAFERSATIDNYNPASAGQAFHKKSTGTPYVTPQGVTSFTIGTAGNIFTCLQNRNYLWADPSINSVTFSHRYKVGSGTNNVGFLTFDYSKNGGAAGSWTNNAGTVYDPAGAPVSAFGARYPQGVIYNPPGNTIADSAYFCYYAPTRDNTNPSGTGDWGGVAWGSQQLSGLGLPTQVDTGSNQAPTTTDYWFVIPDHMFLTKTGVSHVIERNAKGDGTNAYPTTDTLIYTRGTWDTTMNNFIYQREKLVIPVSNRQSSTTKLLADVKITFADNGQDGYLSFIGHNDFAATAGDSTYYLFVYKTADGGDNWTGPTNIVLDGIAPFFPQFVSAGINNFTTAFEHAAVVDSLGNLHMIVGIGGQPVQTGVPTPWSILSAPGNWGLFDVHTDDKGTSWKATLLDFPQFFRGTFGQSAGGGASPDVNEDTRPFASRNWDGNKLVFSWYVSDSVTNFGLVHGNKNIYPDLFTKGYDVNTDMWTTTVNQTGGLASPLAGAIYFGNSSYYTFETGSGIKLPVEYASFTPNKPTDVDVEFNYLDSVILDNSGFNTVGQSAVLFTGYSSVEDGIENHLKVSQNIPNPFNSTSVITVSVAENANVSLEIYNSLGQLVISEAPQSLNAGSHNFIVNGNVLNKGIYFYTVKANDYSITKRMIVQ